MVKEEEIMAMAEAGGGRGYMDMLGALGEDAMSDYFLCPSPSASSYLSSAAVSTTTTTSSASTHAAASPSCASYLQPPPAAPYQHVLSFGGRAEQQYHGGDVFGFQYYYCGGGGPAVPLAVPQKSSPTTDCSSSISSMSSSPTATSVSAISTSKPQPAKKRGSRGSGDQRKAAPPAASTNKRPRVRKERLGERILALQQLVSPFGKTDTASVLHEALGYIRFLHDQVQVLSSPYLQRLPPSSSSSAPRAAPEPPREMSDLRSRGLCLVPVACTDHVAGGNGNSADVWSSVAAMGPPPTAAEEEYTVAARMLA